MENIKSLQVFYNNIKVGNLAVFPNGLTVFEYDDKCYLQDLKNG